jgi:LmbE family N-acetylglucosaminyl deacetylase
VSPTSTLVFAHAHPDDESIFTGAIMRRAADRGARVVLITATGGEAGECRIRLAAGETLRRRRRNELERACEALGVTRLVMLGYRDSGAHRGPYSRGTLGAASVSDVARRIARVVREEDADALVYYEHRGITGHIDHRQVHRAGRDVVACVGLAGYEVTLDGDALRRGAYPLARSAADDPAWMGAAPGAISLTVESTPRELEAKRVAMAAHDSQIGPESLDPSAFGGRYACEWFTRRGRAGVLDALAGEPRPAQRIAS